MLIESWSVYENKIETKLNSILPKEKTFRRNICQSMTLTVFGLSTSKKVKV